LSVPGTARPTSARLREALFDIWQPRVTGARVVDLFAGTGAVGFEALSRGAGFVLFVESDRRAVRRLQSVCSELAPDSTDVCRADLPSEMNRVLRVTGKDNDLVFADPPYDFADYEKLLVSLVGLLDKGGEVAVEHSARSEVPNSVGGLERTDTRTYGENRVTFFSLIEEL
jgi:16S rRNA (guanine(966)-N(2))-methyltransferase RsmD